jgi:hypothetical protein
MEACDTADLVHAGEPCARNYHRLSGSARGGGPRAHAVSALQHGRKRDIWPGRWTGLSLSGSWTYCSDFVASYEDRHRYQLEYPGYGIAAVRASYSLRRGVHTHGFGLAVRNLFDVDLLRKLARLGAGREISASYRLMW